MLFTLLPRRCCCYVDADIAERYAIIADIAAVADSLPRHGQPVATRY